MIKGADISHNTSILRPACWGLRRQTRFILISCLCAHASVYVHNWFHLIALPRSGNLRWSRENNRSLKGQAWSNASPPIVSLTAVKSSSRTSLLCGVLQPCGDLWKSILCVYVWVCVCLCLCVCVGVTNCNWHWVFYFENSRKWCLNVNYDDLINEKGRIAEDNKSLQPR